ncbi:menaquinone biosynthesis protein [Cohnella lubricantis]|uniref:Chorismate dehydratase n=1 Tax=Cohnella lubricantis TaxID=2163172 RepID=A0A841TCL1_9BACL|nr:menaquinone biosynthesis protein [Cohnella lubricantis]MBB6677749.1 menaquinone biosynthesis protein [Cohnella lubricantis]MBP2117711.1 chorismate dehydratase [Cohnella lubricantis]
MTKADATRPIRFGRIDYTNVWPVFHYFDPAKLRSNTELVYGMPAELNRQLRAGEIDISAVSSFAYGLNADDYLLLPDLSVSALGEVQSLLLFLKSPLEKVLSGKIALTTTSATTVNLLKIVMKKFLGGDPEYVTTEPDLERMLETADAALLIGDHAIRASWRDHGYRVLDLGDLWRQWTGQWMTFAVWAVRREAAERYPEAIGEIYRALVDSKRQSAADPVPLIQEAERRIGGTASYWRGYFGGLCHDFGAEQREGLSLYFQYAKELGLMDKSVRLADWSEASARV